MATKFIQIKLAKRYILMKSLGWLFLVTTLALIVATTEFEKYVFNRQLEFFNNFAFEEFIFIASLFSVLAFVLLQRTLCWYHIKIKALPQSIEIFRGVFLQTSIMIPLTKIAQITIGRDLKHLLLGLYYIEIFSSAPLLEDSKAHSIRIEALRHQDAISLRNKVERFTRRLDFNYVKPERKGSEINQTTHIPFYHQPSA